MRIVVRPVPEKTSGGVRPSSPTFESPWSNPRREILENLRAALDSRRPPRRYYRDIFPELFIPPWKPQRSYLASGLMHAALVMLVWSSPSLFTYVRRQPPLSDTHWNTQRLTYYQPVQELPGIRPSDQP